MLEQLKHDVCKANRALADSGLVIHTFGNVSGIDREGGRVAIKPSGVAYEDLDPEQIVVLSLETGQVIEGDLRPSSDAPTHLELYRRFESVAGIVHTHSLHATAWAQAQREIPPLGTTHADYFYGAVLCTRPLTDEEIETEYEANTGKVIAERFADVDVRCMPGVLVANHGPYAWGSSAGDALHNAVILEYLAQLAATTTTINPYPRTVSPRLLQKHYLRKHGPDAYYGQK